LAGYSTISAEFAQFLHTEHRRILPFVGAGVSVDAGVPAAADLARLIAARAREDGADISELELGFSEVCSTVTAQLGHGTLQEITAHVVSGLPLTPTPLQRLIVRCPLGVIVTTNYESSLSVAAEQAGLIPVVRTPEESAVLAEPGEGEVVILHLHGTVERPKTIALPGPSMKALASDEALKVVLRGLVAARSVVYLGYRLPPDDAYLQGELRLLRELFSDRREHRVLIPRSELQLRAAEFEQLQTTAGVRVETFDSSKGYQALQHAALLIAPAKTTEAPGEALARVREQAVTNYYLHPPILPIEPENDRDFDSRVAIAQMGLGTERLISVEDLLDERCSLIVGEPGMGKTQLLYRLGRQSIERQPLFIRLSALSAQLLDDDEPEPVLTVAARSAKVFSDGIAPPSTSGLDEKAYLILFDALDEVTLEKRPGVVQMICRIAERYPQHSIVVTSRINGEAMSLAERGFATFRSVRNAGWGRRYLIQVRGIPEERVDEFSRETQTISDLLAIPQYAALIGERLASEGAEDLPATGFELLIDVAVRDLIRQLEDIGAPAESAFRWLRTLAVVLELRGRTEASAAEFATLPAPAGLSSDAARERLVERALLRDVPDIAALQANAIQEALAAHALLEADDPKQTLLAVAASEIAGEIVFRRDLDHMIDLFYEGAPSELRAELRALDELRWARTARGDLPSEEIGYVLDAIWRIYLEREVWIDRNGGREVRDARSAVERLVRAAPQEGERRRAAWLAATASERPTEQANAAFCLQQLERDRDTLGWIERLLNGSNAVVRRHAAVAARTIYPKGEAAEVLDALRAAYGREADELAAETIGYALLGLTDQEDLPSLVRSLRNNPTGWLRLSYGAPRQLRLSDALRLFLETGISSREDENLLDEIADRTPLADWMDGDVQMLAALAVDSRRILHGRFKGAGLLEELATAHPEAALAGAADSASVETVWPDVLFLQRIPLERLREAASGDLERPLGQLIEIIERREQGPADAEEGELVQIEPGVPKTLQERLDDPGFVGAVEIVGIDSTELSRLAAQVTSLVADQRALLTEAVERWFPTNLTASIKLEDGRGSCPRSLPPALAFSAALDLPLTEKRWMEIFTSGAVWFSWDAANWLKRHYPHGHETEIAELVASMRSETRLRLALDSLPDGVAPEIGDAVAAAFIAIDRDDAVFLLARVRESAQTDVLKKIRSEARSPLIRRQAQRELAEAGDADAQREELRLMIDDIRRDPAAYSLDGFTWAGQVQPEVVAELGALLRVVVTASDRSGDLSRRVQTALAATRSEAAVALYDELIADANVDGASFLRYQRDEIARTLASERSLAALPTPLDELASWLAARGVAIA
jgi:hypothetical protein